MLEPDFVQHFQGLSHISHLPAQWRLLIASEFSHFVTTDLAEPQFGDLFISRWVMNVGELHHWAITLGSGFLPLPSPVASLYSSAVTHGWVALGRLPNFSEHCFPHPEIRGNDNAFSQGLSEVGEKIK